MDIGKLVDYNKVVKLELKNPATKEPLGITFDVISANSDPVKEVIRKQANDRIAAGDNEKQTVEQGEALTVERLAASVVGWDWGEHKYNGEVPEFTHSNVVKVLDEIDWIFGQVNKEANRLPNFMNG